MLQPESPSLTRSRSSHRRVGYVVKRYPRYSETFVVNEILAHQDAGLDIAIYALRPPVDTHFQSIIGRVRAPVKYLTPAMKSTEWWSLVHECGSHFSNLWNVLPEEGWNDPRIAHQAMELAVSAHRDDLTHFHAHFATDAAAVARLASLITGIPYSLTAHAKDIFHETVDWAVLSSKIRDAHRVITVSDYNVRFLEERWGGPITNLKRIYNGIDLDKFDYVEPLQRQPVILGVGRLVEKKGFQYLIEACAILRGRSVDFRCRILGTGELEDELHALVEANGLSDRVEMPGPRPSSEVVEALNEAAVLAVPCVVGSDGNRDGLPTVLLEAMAVGTPCVSTDVTGIPEVAINEQTALQVPQHDAVSLADALERLLGDAQLRVRLARAARHLIEQEFDIRKNAASIRTLFAAKLDSAELGRVTDSGDGAARQVQEVG